ncbi:MAG: HipA N-terminal domain-containing protein [Candidatus Humimicrobiaceae bacterium]
MTDSAIIYYHDKLAGLLKKTQDGYEFSYNSDYLKDKNSKPISLSMPLSGKKYFSAMFFPFFDNLLPEGWLLEQIISRLKIDKNDKFNLLLHVGNDTVGAVKIVPLEEEQK